MVVQNVPKVVDEFRFPRLPSVLLPLGKGGQLVIELCGAPMLAFVDCLLLIRGSEGNAVPVQEE